MEAAGTTPCCFTIEFWRFTVDEMFIMYPLMKFLKFSYGSYSPQMLKTRKQHRASYSS